MLPRHHVRSGPDVICKCTRNLDQISEVKGMALAWCDSSVSAEPTANGLAFDLLGDCTTTLGDIAYTLQKVRLLLPSAHRLWHHPSPLEVQFIHETECGDRLVLAVLFREGEPSPDVHSAIASILLEHEMVRLTDLIPLSRYFFMHNIFDQVEGTPHREVHVIHTLEMAICPALLADLNVRAAR